MATVIGKRRKAREAALQFLFQEDFLKNRFPPEELPGRFTGFCEYFTIGVVAREYALHLVGEYRARAGQVDSLIEQAATNWRLSRIAAVDRNLFFKLRLNFVSLYYADRSDKRVADFDRRYVAAFGTLPSLYSYRGYDAVKLFAGRVLGGVIGGGDLAAAVNGQDAGLLQMPYNFVQPSPNATHVNDAWGLVQYHDDYTITVK